VTKVVFLVPKMAFFIGLCRRLKQGFYSAFYPVLIYDTSEGAIHVGFSDTQALFSFSDIFN
jgi:hypothetical protein